MGVSVTFSDVPHPQRTMGVSVTFSDVPHPQRTMGVSVTFSDVPHPQRTMGVCAPLKISAHACYRSGPNKTCAFIHSRCKTSSLAPYESTWPSSRRGYTCLSLILALSHALCVVLSDFITRFCSCEDTCVKRFCVYERISELEICCHTIVEE